jgi:hypothetical protein
MNTLQVDILNPKAAKLLKDLADLNLLPFGTILKAVLQPFLKSYVLKQNRHQHLTK